MWEALSQMRLSCWSPSEAPGQAFSAKETEAQGGSSLPVGTQPGRRPYTVDMIWKWRAVQARQAPPLASQLDSETDFRLHWPAPPVPSALWARSGREQCPSLAWEKEQEKPLFTATHSPDCPLAFAWAR